MDKRRELRYNTAHSMRSIVTIAIGLLSAGAALADPEPSNLLSGLTKEGSAEIRDIEGAYESAYTMLEDKTIQNVSLVPTILEACARQGHRGAKKLLLDVYEGKRKGLEPAPVKARKLADALAKESMPEGVSAHQLKEALRARAEARYRLALYYERGFGGEASPTNAYKWMRRAALDGLPEALVECSRYLMLGIGHQAMPREALRNLLYAHAKAPDTPNLYFYLGYMCLKGLGMKRPNVRQARIFFEYGASRNDARAINNLASMCENGIGGEKNVRYALRLYKWAAALGNRDASLNMQRLAYYTDIEQRHATPLRTRVAGAALRIIEALPLSEIARRWLMESFRKIATES